MIKFLSWRHVTASIVGLMVPPATAEVLVTVDARNPNAVIFTSTDAPSAADYSSLGAGLAFHNLVLGGSDQGHFQPPGNFRVFASGAVYNSYSPIADSLLVNASGLGHQLFIQGTQAFAGTTTVDLSLSNIAKTSFIGQIEMRTSNGVHTGVMIGEFRYLAVPGNAYWSGGLGDGLWSSKDDYTTNWVNASSGGGDTMVAPGASTNVFFAAESAAGSFYTQLGSDFTINSLNYNANVQSGVISDGPGNHTLTINASGANDNTEGNGITVAAGAGAQQINSSIILGASQTWTNHSHNALQVSGSVSGDAQLTKAGAGTIFLHSTGNSYTGGDRPA